ncbi:hypothetical protein HOE04_05430 [archaeon]|jgi:hypothetical protein|nr:hypothetical protein [archaeon]
MVKNTLDKELDVGYCLGKFRTGVRLKINVGEEFSCSSLVKGRYCGNVGNFQIPTSCSRLPSYVEPDYM